MVVIQLPERERESEREGDGNVLEQVKTEQANDCEGVIRFVFFQCLGSGRLQEPLCSTILHNLQRLRSIFHTGRPIT